MKLKFLLSLVLLIVYCNLFGQSPAWEWEKSAGGNRYDVLSSITVDDSGNVYATGLFSSSSISFGSFILNKDSISNNSSAIYIVKFDKLGNVIWAKCAGGKRNDNGADIKIDQQRNLYLTGGFSSPKIIFDTDTLVKDTTNAQSDIFTAKFNDSGNIIWAKREGGKFLDEGQSICTDNWGNVFVTGAFQSPNIAFGNDTLINNSGFINIFLVKYDSVGNVKWAKCGKGIYNDNEGYHVACDSYGNSYVMGQFYNDTISFDNFPLINAGIVNDDFFMVKYDSLGNLVWAKREGGNNHDFGNSLSIDINNNIYVVGHFISDTLAFGNISLIKDTTPNKSDIFIVKFDSSGVVQWAKSEGGTKSDYASTISVDVNGNLYVGGSYSSPSITFGSFTLVNDTSNNSTDIFIVKYDNGGNVIWAKSAGGSGDDFCESVVSSSLGAVYIGGYFNSSVINFGASTLINDTTNNTSDIFIAKLSSTTGIPEVSEVSNQIMIFPNPSNGYVIVKSKNKIDTVELTNLLGQVIFKTPINENEFSFQLKNSGTYLLHTITNNLIETRKLIVVK